MTAGRCIALALFGGAVFVATLADRVPENSRRGTGGILAGDFHVHGYPVDGTLPGWELRREAARRGLDVIAVTNHNQTLAGRVARWFDSGDVITIAGQELTTPGFHIAAVGIAETIDWRLAASAAIAEIHRQGGVAIAAHPVSDSWRTRDEQALADLDGVEAAHSLLYFEEFRRPELEAFYARVRAVNPDVAAIGSSDFHFFPDMGLCRTYVFAAERSERGVLDALRHGRTVASDGQGHFTGDPARVAAVKAHLAQLPQPNPVTRQLHRLASAAALLGLLAVVIFR